MEIHTGHRERLKRRFLETELNGFDDVNALELLLFYAIPRVDTNPIAHVLLDRFGSLHGVFEASVEELKKVPGVGENTAIFLHLIPAVAKRYMLSKKDFSKSIETTEDLYDYVIPLFAFHTDEYLYMFCMDSANKVLHTCEISHGAVDMVNVDTRKIIATVLERHASKIILAHNHPSGVLTPSDADIAISRTLENALQVFGVELMDHVIVGDGECLSMRSYGYF